MSKALVRRVLFPIPALFGSLTCVLLLILVTARITAADLKKVGIDVLVGLMV